MKNEKRINYLINLSFFLYFCVLIIERIISIIMSISNGVSLYGTFYNGYTYTLTIVSILAFLIFLFVFCKDNIKALFKFNGELDYEKICIASGILLLSGMVHTGYTNPPIQFISYGILILGILLFVIKLSKNAKNKIVLWLSFVYLVSFSMAIPVMYESKIEHAFVFHMLEAIGSIILVFTFIYLMKSLFSGKIDLFNILPILLATVIDAIIIIMRWNESINYFVLIFISLSIVLFVIGYIVKKFVKIKE